MINKVYIVIILTVLSFFLIEKTRAVEQFNFDITEIEILENGNLFKGIKRGTITSNSGIVINANYFDIGNRALAIRTAIKNAEPNEVILVAGKGHESEQIYKNQIIKISDKKIIKKLKVRIKKI